MTKDRESWMLVCPPKNWREPVTIKEHELELTITAMWVEFRTPLTSKAEGVTASVWFGG